jgi:membrane-associated phospholipid phosphatase
MQRFLTDSTTRVLPTILPTSLAAPLLAVVLALSPQVALTQDQQQADISANRAVSGSARFDSTAMHHSALFTAHDAIVVVGGVAVITALMPMDHSIATAFQGRSLQSNRPIRRTLDAVNELGDPGVFVFSVGTYILGLGTHSHSVAALGMHTGEAILMSGTITEVLKGAFGRARPYVDITKPRNFNFGKGFTSDDYASFPSGDVTLAFAAATAASSEVASSWPGASRYVTPVSYGAAAIVGVARLYKNQHWASDVVAGAGVGTLSGVLIDRYNRAFPHNAFNRMFLSASIVPERNGAQVAWSGPF